MIDEYQDTSDIQETFINYIANNNVYMVGDIKQSIYRFRNANPNLFKDKYLKYSQEIDGKKIDLKENFRSRKEVLSDINLIFSDLMTLSFGGADYVNSHQMIYANHAKYDNNSLKDQDQHMEILSYQTLKGDRFKEGETEAFIIAYDIKNKIENKFQVYDEETKKLRNATYSDFVILIDRGDSFSLYKKIFEYFKIPLSIYKDEKLEDSIEISLILNIMQLMQKVKNKEYDKKFKFLFMSIARSFLYETLDNDILLYLMNKNYKDHPLMKSIYNVLKLESIYSIQELQYSILKEFGFYEYWMKIGNLEEITIRLAYLDKYAKMFDSAGYTIDEYINFLEKVLDEKMSIRYSIEKKSVGSCKIMTIHNSKGLQFPICYYSGLNKKFNNDETKKELYFSDTYGIIIPSLLLNKKDTFLKKLYLYNLQKEDLSEKLRLFYVALTRCEEKIIIVTPELKEETKSLHCFADFLTLIQNKLKGYIKLVNLNNIKRTDKYDIIRNHNFDEIFNNNINDNIEVNNSLTIASFENVKKHYSKVTNEIISTNTYHNMQYGTKIHEILEHLDLKNPNIINEIDALNITNEEKKYLNLFLKSDLIKNIDKANVYQEYHFVFQDDGVTKEGIIDLMLEYDDYIHIIDYKLKNVNDDAYINQLNGYKNYISHIKNKPINLYLYSIEDGIIKEIH